MLKGINYDNEELINISYQDYLGVIQVSLKPRHGVRLRWVLELVQVHLKLPVEPHHLLTRAPLCCLYLT